MTKQELEEKIKHNGSVWYISKKYIDYESIEEIKLNDNYTIETQGLYNALIWGNASDEDDRYISDLEYIFNSKAEAQHYLDNGNVTRTEKLPFVTWEEFKNGKDMTFYNSPNNEYILTVCDNEIIIGEFSYYDEELSIYKSFELSEDDFNKAYKECKKIFNQKNNNTWLMDTYGRNKKVEENDVDNEGSKYINIAVETHFNLINKANEEIPKINYNEFLEKKCILFSPLAFCNKRLQIYNNKIVISNDNLRIEDEFDINEENYKKAYNKIKKWYMDIINKRKGEE